MSTLRAILFDFDGVLANTEPLHFQMFREVLKGEGINLTEKGYYDKYLGLDDRACFEAVFRDCGKKFSPKEKERLVGIKNRKMLDALSQRSILLPGAHEFVQKVAGRYYLAIVSGALRSEIEQILKSEGILKSFQVIVSAEEVKEGKPSPEGFLKAIRLLNRDSVPESEILLPRECLAIEDSPWGIEAAKKAETVCAALTTSYIAAHLRVADHVFKDLKELEKGLLI